MLVRSKIKDMIESGCASAEVKRRWRMELEGPVTMELYEEVLETAVEEVRRRKER